MYIERLIRAFAYIVQRLPECCEVSTPMTCWCKTSLPECKGPSTLLALASRACLAKPPDNVNTKDDFDRDSRWTEKAPLIFSQSWTLNWPFLWKIKSIFFGVCKRSEVVDFEYTTSPGELLRPRTMKNHWHCFCLAQEGYFDLRFWWSLCLKGNIILFEFSIFGSNASDLCYIPICFRKSSANDVPPTRLFENPNARELLYSSLLAEAHTTISLFRFEKCNASDISLGVPRGCKTKPWSKSKCRGQNGWSKLCWILYWMVGSRRAGSGTPKSFVMWKERGYESETHFYTWKSSHGSEGIS
jgi:hypothetical protein